MVKKTDVKEYQKPELVSIDDPTFDETGQGTSGILVAYGCSPSCPTLV